MHTVNKRERSARGSSIYLTEAGVDTASWDLHVHDSLSPSLPLSPTIPQLNSVAAVLSCRSHIQRSVLVLRPTLHSERLNLAAAILVGDISCTIIWEPTAESRDA